MTKHAHGHRKRLRDRLLSAGHALADYEVLELLLGHVLLRRDTKPLAKELLDRFGSLRGVLDARTQELAAVPGFGPALEAYWCLLREMMARYEEAPARQRMQLCSPQAVARMARVRLAGSDHEEFWIAYLDSQNRLISWEMASKGSVETVPLYPRDVMARALALKASSLILVHNHPGGSPKPSGNDLSLTEKIRDAGAPLGIRVMDHVIVTENDCYSLHEDRIISPGI